jgi:hypothetical protein
MIEPVDLLRRSPTVSSVQSQCKDILSRQYMKDVMKYSVSSGLNGIPQLEYEIDTEAIERLSDTYLGKNIIVLTEDRRIIDIFPIKFNFLIYQYVMMESNFVTD